jgi:hypothetical protein
MRHWRELAILIVLVIVAVRIWAPKAGKETIVSPVKTSSASEQAITASAEAPNRRSKFVDWGRNPFVWSQREESTGGGSNVKLRAIICSGEEVCAALNESIVRVGDRIVDKTVKRIERDRVILTDGTTDYVLELQE